jgi:hypothetical protein
MNPARLRELIATGLTDHADITQCANTGTILMDRIALNVFDQDGYVWRVHVLKEPRRAGEAP